MICNLSFFWIQFSLTELSLLVPEEGEDEACSSEDPLHSLPPAKVSPQRAALPMLH